jgi:hypothetical protein
MQTLTRPTRALRTLNFASSWRLDAETVLPASPAQTTAAVSSGIMANRS